MIAVKASKSGYSTRVTVPRPFFDKFATIGFQSNGHHWPLLALRVKDDAGKPYFSNCDFGLELFLGSPEEFTYRGTAIYEAGKNNANRYFTLPKGYATQLAIFADTTLEVDVLDNPRPQPNFYDKIIAYKRVWQS